MSDYRLEERCPHGEQTPLDCKICDGKLKDKNVGSLVYFTAGGTHYHYSKTCPALVYGQQLVEERGGTPAPIESAYEDSVKYERTQCKTCKKSKESKK